MNLYCTNEVKIKQCKYAERHIKVGTSGINLMWLNRLSLFVQSTLRPSLVAGHFGKGGFELLSDRLELLLLRGELVLQPVHLLLKFLDRLFGKLSPCLSLLQLGSQVLDLLLVASLPLVGLLLGHLQGLQVVGHNPQLLLQLNNLDLSNLSSLLGPLQVGLSLSEFLLHLVVLFVRILCLVPG